MAYRVVHWDSDCHCYLLRLGVWTMSRRNPYAITIPIGMTDLIILFGPINGRAFKRMVHRAIRKGG